MTEIHPRAWRSVGLLTVALILCTMDRTLPGVLGEPIRISLAISDTQLALLVGTAFATCYAMCSLPMGWLADRHHRPRIIATGIVIWCMATAACGFATGFNSMFVFRMGVGVGEAALVPAAVSLLADLIPRAALPRAMGIFNAGGLFGIALAYPIGGALAKGLEGAAANVAAWLPSEGWRLTFVLIGVTGLSFVLLVLMLPEPRADGAFSKAARPEAQEPLLPYLKRSASFTVPLLASLVLLNVYANGYLMWLTPYFSRTHGWELPKIGQWLGISVLVAGIAGSLLGGWLTTTLTRRTGKDAAMRVSGGVLALLGPLAVLTPMAPNGDIAMLLVALQLTLAFCGSATMPTVLVNASPPHLRARFFATNLFLGQLVGAGMGPALFAAITDHVFHDQNKLYLSLSIGAAVVFVPLFGLLWKTTGQYQLALDRASSGQAPAPGRIQGE